MSHKYPIISAGKVTELTVEFLESGSARDVSNETTMSGTGPELELPDLDALALHLEEQLEAFLVSDRANDRDHFEARAAVELHKAVRHLPIHVVDDPGFWRFVAMAHFWWLVRWRESAAFESGDPARYRRYVDATNPSEAVLTRMFLRAAIGLHDVDDYSLVTAVPDATDFWRSHILRVGTSYAPTVARAFVREQADRRMTATDELRPYARRLNRLSTNVLLPYLDDGDAASIIGDLRKS